jgi:imidazolonepropionase
LTTLFINIAQLVNVRESSEILRGKALAHLPVIRNAYLLVEDGIIAAYGNMYELEINIPNLPEIVEDVSDQFVLPCWCDSHTHIVYAGSRENEFIDKINGLSYADIAANGGGILNSAKKLNETSEDSLFSHAMLRLNEMAKLGTGAAEIKSGYGLSVEGELKMLRVIKRIKAESDLSIKATFLGAHAFPEKYKDDQDGYINVIIDEMLPVIASEKLADYIDVFCEKGFFSVEQTDRICKAGLRYGLKPKLHVNQLNSIGGIECGIKNNAVSLDHLETLTEHEIALLGKYAGISTLLPTAAFFLRMNYQPAKMLINAGAAIALASDYNPGSSPSGNMNFVNALSCIQMRMMPEEVINASTLNGAFAMEVQGEAGSISAGKNANLIFTKKIPSLAFLFYSFGTNNIERVMIKGNWVT